MLIMDSSADTFWPAGMKNGSVTPFPPNIGDNSAIDLCSSQSRCAGHDVFRREIKWNGGMGLAALAHAVRIPNGGKI